MRNADDLSNIACPAKGLCYAPRAAHQPLHRETEHMAQGETIYAKAGCPFTFRFILFVNDVDTLSDYTLRVAQGGDPSYDAICSELEAATGAKASFPSMRLATGEVLVGSEALMEHVAQRKGCAPTSTPIVDYFNQHMAPASRSLFAELRAVQARLAALEE